MTKPSVFQLIDLDRTLFDTSKFVKAITDEINLLQPGFGTELDARFEEAYKKEETFFLLRYLRREKGDAWFEALVDRVIEAYGAMAFLLPGAVERLAFARTLTDEPIAWGIFTYGDKVDQYMKLRIIGLEDAPVYFSHTPNKSEILQLWATADGRFQLPSIYGGGVVDMLTLEDDKLRAFHDLPKGVIGLWIEATGNKAGDQYKEQSDARDIVRVHSLFESIEYLTQRFL